jgi:large subunit ribosomal protein L21
MTETYALVELNGKQYKVAPGEIIEVDLLPYREGSQLELDKVLLMRQGDEVMVGKPWVEGAKVMAKVLGNKMSKKLIVFKYKPKVRYRRKTGHRQQYTQLAIEQIHPALCHSERSEESLKPSG